MEIIKYLVVIVISILFIITISILGYTYYYPQKIFKIADKYLSNYLISNYDAKLDYDNIEGDLYNGFTIKNPILTSKDTIISYAKSIYININYSDLLFGNITSSSIVIDKLNLNIDNVKSKIKDKKQLTNYKINLKYIFDSCDLRNSIITFNNIEYYTHGLFKIIYSNHFNLSINSLLIKNSKSMTEYYINQGSIGYIKDNIIIDDLYIYINDLYFYLNSFSYNLNNNIFSKGKLKITDIEHLKKTTDFTDENFMIDIIIIDNKIQAESKGSLDFEDLKLSNLSGIGRISNNNLFIDSINYNLNDKLILSSGEINFMEKYFKFNTVLKNFKFKSYNIFSLKSNIVGSINDNGITGFLNINKLQIDSVQIPNIQIDYSFIKGLKFPFDIVFTSNEFSGSMKLNYINSYNYNIKGQLKISDLNFKNYIKKLDESKINADINLSYYRNLESTKILFDLKSKDGYYNTNSFDEVIASLIYYYDNNNYKIISNANISGYQNNYTSWKEIILNMNYNDLDSSFFKIHSSSFSNNFVDINLKSKFDDNYFTGNVNGLISETPIIADEFHILKNNNTYIIPTLDLQIGNSYNKFSFNYINRNKFNISGKLSNLNINYLKFINKHLNRLDGLISNSEFIISNNGYKYPIIMLNTKILNGNIDEVEFENVDLSVSYRDNRFLINFLDLETEFGELQLNGWIHQSVEQSTLINNKMNLNLKYDNIDIIKFNRYFPFSYEVRGLVSGDIDISGSMYDPIIKSNINIASPGFDKINANSLSSNIYYSNYRLDFKHLNIGTTHGTFYGNGFMPINFTNNEINIFDKPIDFMFTAKTNSLNFIAPYFTEIDSIVSDIYLKNDFSYSIQLLMNGTLSSTIKNGMVIVNNGSLYLDPINEPITNINGSLNIVNNKIIIEKLSGDILGQLDSSPIQNFAKFLSFNNKQHHSKLNIYGSIDIEDFSNPNYALNFVGNNIMTSSSYDIFNGIVDMDINITGKDTVVIGGDLIPRPYDFTITSLGTKEDYDIDEIYSTRNIIYDLHVPIINPIRIKTENINLLISGDLNINNSSDNNYKFFGNADIVEGSFYDNQGNIFQNTTGTIVLSPIDNAPYIDLTAETIIDGYPIDIEFIGYIDNPQLFINNNTDLKYSDTQILQILTFGDSDTQLDNTETAGNLLTNFIENEIEKNIAQYTPLDEFQLSSNTSFLKNLDGNSDINLKLHMGKQFTNRIYLNTELDINNFNRSKYEATYRINNRTSIVGGLDVENKWHFKYRIKYYY